MKLSAAEQILLEVASLCDLMSGLDEIRRHPYKTLARSFPQLKKDTAYRAVKKLLSTGDIGKEVRGNEVYLCLTSQGWGRLRKTMKLTELGKKWNGIWRVLVFDIPENSRIKRDQLRLRLYEIGFGHLQKSVWVSPFDLVREVLEFLKFQRLDEGVLIFEAKEIGPLTNQQVADQAWGLSNLSERYKDLVSEFESKKNDLRAREEYFAKYSTLLRGDPVLPKPLLPDNWGGEKARELFFNLAKSRH